MCSTSLGRSANAWIRSSRNPIGCGEVKRRRSRPSMSCTASSNCTNGLLPCTTGNSWRPNRFTIWPRSVTSFTPRATSSRTSRAISAMARLRSAPRVCGTMQNVQCMLHPCMMETNAVACRLLSSWSRIVSAEPFSSSVSQIEKLFHGVGYTMKFLGPDDEIHMRHSRKKRVALRLGHAAEKTEDDLGPALRDLPQHSHFAERLLIRHVANAACVQQNDVRVDLARRAFIAPRQERVRNLFGIALVHLAAVGFDEKFWHRESGIVTQTGRPRHNELNERRDFGNRHHRWKRPLSDGRRGGRRRAPRPDAVRRSFRRDHRRPHARTAGVFFAAARPRTSPAPARAEPSREHLRAPLAERALDHLCDGRRKPAGTIRAPGCAPALAILRSDESTGGPYVFRKRDRRTRELRRADLAEPAPHPRGVSAGPEHQSPQRRHLREHGWAGFLDPGGIGIESPPGL